MLLRCFCKLLLAFFITECCVSSLSSATFCDRPEIGKSRLVQLIVVTRHGDRTPIQTFPNDPYQNAYWSAFGGFGQLTQQGITNQHNLGAWLKQCYSGLEGVSKRTVTAYSTPYDRTIMSAQSFLSGFLSDPKVTGVEQVIHPVHALPSKYIPVECKTPFCGDDVSAIVNAEEKKYSELVKYISKEAGFNSSTYLEISSKMADAVGIERRAGLQLADWIAGNETVLNLMQEMLDFVFRLNYNTSLPARTKSASAPVMNFVVDYLKNASFTRKNPKIKQREPTPKLLLLSGHDSTVSPLLAALGDFNMRHPPFCAAVLIELTASDDDSQSPLQVSVFYRNTSTEEPYPVKVRNGCGNSCSLDKFLEAVKEALVPVTLETPSRSPIVLLQSVIPSDVKVALFIFVAFCLAVTIITCYGIVACTRRRRRKILYMLNQPTAWQPSRRSVDNQRPHHREATSNNSNNNSSSRDDFFNNDFDDEEDDDFGDESTLLMMQMPSGSSNSDATRMPLLMSSMSSNNSDARRLSRGK